jgi:hypothetical protein
VVRVVEAVASPLADPPGGTADDGELWRGEVVRILRVRAAGPEPEVGPADANRPWSIAAESILDR